MSLGVEHRDPLAAALEDAKWAKHYGHNGQTSHTFPSQQTQAPLPQDDYYQPPSDTQKPKRTPDDPEAREEADTLSTYFKEHIAGEMDAGDIDMICNDNLKEWAPSLMDRKIYCDALISTNTHPHIPYYCTQVSNCKLYGEFVFKEGSLQRSFYKPDSPYGFQSRHAYRQGKNIPLSDQRQGDVENVFICQLSLVVWSECPFPIAVRVGSRKTNNTFVPYNKTEVVVPMGSIGPQNTSIKRPDTECHGVIPTKAQGVVVSLYMSGPEVNDPFGAKYPYLTMDIEKITHGCVQVGKTKMAIPRRSPILEWVYQNAAYYGWNDDQNLPQQLDKEVDGCAFEIKNEVFQTAIRAIQEKIQHCIPVRNLNEFCLEFTPLVHSPAARLSLQAERTRRHKEFQSALQTTPHNTMSYKGGQSPDSEIRDIMDSYVFTFELQSAHIFRTEEGAT